MAMNKTEQSMVEDLKTKLALRWTDNVKPDLAPPTEISKIINGYGFNRYTRSVSKSCSSCIYHSDYQWDKTSSQNAIHQYSTELLAYKALRHSLEKEYAGYLRGIDKKIELLENN